MPCLTQPAAASGGVAATALRALSCRLARCWSGRTIQVDILLLHMPLLLRAAAEVSPPTRTERRAKHAAFRSLTWLHGSGIRSQGPLAALQRVQRAPCLCKAFTSRSPAAAFWEQEAQVPVDRARASTLGHDVAVTKPCSSCKLHIAHQRNRFPTCAPKPRRQHQPRGHADGKQRCNRPLRAAGGAGAQGRRQKAVQQVERQSHLAAFAR